MEKEFPKGLFAKKPHENAPKFVIAKLSVKREELIAYLQEKPDEWLNFDVTESKDGKYITSLDTWKPDGEVKQEVTPEVDNSIDVESIPF